MQKGEEVAGAGDKRRLRYKKTEEGDGKAGLCLTLRWGRYIVINNGFSATFRPTLWAFGPDSFQS